FPIEIPPLRERVEDIVTLTKHFISIFAEGENIKVTDEVFSLLKKYPFPGNTRELRNLCERMVLLNRNSIIDQSIIPPEIKFPKGTVTYTTLENKSLVNLLEEVERNAITHALEKTNGNKAKAAELLGIPASTLKSKMAKF
ncbi:MAG: sigma-54-dependent Fis family transcriptional regulator, partial [Bacteroidetes bacterium]